MMARRSAQVSATCLNQFALDFEGNYQRILKSIQIAKREGSRFRCGPELEICGYSCEDHFYESDTLNHSWEVLEKLLNNEETRDILVDVGMPVLHNGVTYNCRIIFLNKEINFIRPKRILCDDGNYRESRWFTPYARKQHIEPHPLPEIIRKIIGQEFAPFGDGLLELRDTKIGFEICEELWVANSTHIEQTLAGAEIIINGSGSHAEIRKASYALELIKSASSKCGGLYIFSNLRGCDGERTYHNGCSAIVNNGHVLAHGQQYSTMDVEVLTVNVDLDEIQIYKNSIRSRTVEASKVVYPSVQINWTLRGDKISSPTLPIPPFSFCIPEEEIAQGPALWLWDYLRRSRGASGFFLPLSGGVDSSSVAIIVYSMCNLLFESFMDPVVQDDIRRVIGDENYTPHSPKELCSQILTTCYMGSENSSQDTRNRAKNLADSIGSKHHEINISSVTKALLEETSKALEGKSPSFGGSRTENLALQNIQARSRMVYAYMFAQLSPWSREKKGFLLVLGTSNVDEAIRGYFTKYDCSSADLNPIGGISKTDLKSFILYAAKKFSLEAVDEIVKAPPTAELQPLESNQTDEEDMGMTYEELSQYGRLRKPLACGPFAMVARLLHLWKDKQTPSEIARKVKHFYVSYAANRHKMCVLTPSCHMENYSPEDHRYDLRPIFYPLNFTWQFRKIDEMIENLEDTD